MHFFKAKELHQMCFSQNCRWFMNFFLVLKCGGVCPVCPLLGLDPAPHVTLKRITWQKIISYISYRSHSFQALQTSPSHILGLYVALIHKKTTCPSGAFVLATGMHQSWILNRYDVIYHEVQKNQKKSLISTIYDCNG